MDIKDLKHDRRNANKHSEHGMEKLSYAINKNGLGRSILISGDNEIIAGNGVTETAKKLGITKVRVIETDGTEIIAVKRTDILSDSKEFFELALGDNIIAKDNIIMDAEVTNAICEDYEIEEYTIIDTKKGKDYDIDDYQENKFPLSITLNKSEMIRWNKIKDRYGLIEDTIVFLKIIELI